jgi:hypothetical protein
MYFLKIYYLFIYLTKFLNNFNPTDLLIFITIISRNNLILTKKHNYLNYYYYN